MPGHRDRGLNPEIHGFRSTCNAGRLSSPERDDALGLTGMAGGGRIDPHSRHGGPICAKRAGGSVRHFLIRHIRL